LINTPQALDAAIAASRHARRERLVRAVRNQRIRTRVAFGLSAGVAICALLAFFCADGLHEFWLDIRCWEDRAEESRRFIERNGSINVDGSAERGTCT
jgi:hypothetical protein